MNKINTIKLVARIIVGAGATSITRTIIQNNVQPTSLIDQITTTAGSLVLGSMAAEAAKSHTDAQIDNVVAAFAKIQDKDATAVK